MDVTNLGVGALSEVCRTNDATSLNAPILLDHEALDVLEKRMGVHFDRSDFDYYLHAYVCAEYFPACYEDPAFQPKLPSELGPPPEIPLPPGSYWVSVRPQNGEEAYQAFKFGELPGEV